MLTYNQQLNSLSIPKRQKGLVLFVALIALVAMSLAAAALVRSVDSSVLAAGNLAFKQSAIMSAESGVARAYRFINENATVLTADGAGYYATLTALNWQDENTWSNAASIGVDNDINDASGNNVRLILQRMCRNPGAVTQDNCLVGMGTSAANSAGTKDYRNAGGLKGGADAVVYRATVRVVGPRNTVSYLQAFIY